jgi:hypothetical protein
VSDLISPTLYADWIMSLLILLRAPLLEIDPRRAPLIEVIRYIYMSINVYAYACARAYINCAERLSPVATLLKSVYRITSIKGARRGSISKRGALNRIKSSIIQSAYKVGDIRSLTKTGYSLSKALVRGPVSS